MSATDPKLLPVFKNFSRLSAATSILNKASGELAVAISQLDEMLQNLNIGLTAWVTFRSDESESSEYDEDQLGYSKVSGKWGLAIRNVYGDPGRGHEEVSGPWLFNDASRELRLLAVDKIPDLLELLAKVATETAESVEEKARHVRVMTSAVQTLGAEKTVPKSPPYAPKAMDPTPPYAVPSPLYPPPGSASLKGGRQGGK